MEKLFINIFQMSISASYLILAVLLVRLMLRKAPKSMRSYLWLLVGIRLLVPFSIESVFSLIPNTQVSDSYIYDIAQPKADKTAGAAGITMPVSQPVQNTYIPPVEKSMGKTQTAILLCTRIWILGMALMAGYLLISWIRLRKNVKMSVPVDVALDSGHAKVYQSDTIESPFLFGIISPRIYIPNNISKEELPYVIRHEMAHRKRKDYLIKPAGFLLLSVYWFNPFVWIAYITLCKDIELICDEQVIRQLGVSYKKEYSQALLNSAVNHRIIAACPVAFGEVSVKERVKNILNYKKPAFWVLAAAVLACIIVPVCFMTQKKTDTAENADMRENDNSEDLGTAPDDTENAFAIEGSYEMLCSDADKYLFVPRLTLEEDGRFSFGYDSFSSYMPHGTYELKDDILTALTDDGKYHYQFTCISDADNSLLIFDTEHSSDVSNIDGNSDAPIENGSIFIKSTVSSLFKEVDAITQALSQELDHGNTMAADEFQETLIELEKLKKQLVTEELFLQRQMELSKELQLSQEESAALETMLQILTQQTENYKKQMEEIQLACQAGMPTKEASSTAYDTIEQWARAFCDRDGETIIKLADEKAEQKLADGDILLHDFDGEKDYVSFGWSSPWPWGDNYDEDTAYNYRIMNVTDRSAEILYYAWVSNPHVTVWRELLTYKMENDKYVITSETLQFRDSICTAEEFYQAYPDGIAGTMMDYYSFNGAGEALNDHAKKNSDDQWYSKMLAPDSAAVCLLNILDNPNKVGVNITESDTDSGRCTVSFDFYEDGSSAEVRMIQPYGPDGIWVPYSESPNDLAAPQMAGTLSGSYVITSQNVDSVIAEDAQTLEALFPNHHEFAPAKGFSKDVDLNGDGIMEKIELTNLGYNGGDGGYALKVIDSQTGKQIPLPDGYTEEYGFPFKTYYETPAGEEQPRLRIWLGDANRNETIATIMSDPLIRIYERKFQFDEMKEGYLRKNVFDAQIDAVSGCNIITYNNEKTPTLVLKSYVSGCLGHVDSLGYVITELRLREDNTWDSKHYFLLDSCNDKVLMQQEYESLGNGGVSVLPFDEETEFSFLPLLPDN